MKLKIEALDPLFFRDGRPFALGEESYADGIFPPLPSTVRGAFRSLWMSKQIALPNSKDVDVLARESNAIEINYFGLGIGGQAVFPAPFDLFFPDSGQTAQPMQVISPDFVSSQPSEVSHLFKANANGKTESVAEHLLDLDTMSRYISGAEQTGFSTKRLTNFLKKEHKIGIGRDNETHRTREGLLFRLISNRFDKGLHLLADVGSFGAIEQVLSQKNIVPLGGERRSAAVSEANFSLPTAPKIPSNFFKICLLTPALFNSWYPKHLETEFPGLQLKASTVGKSISVGGWDVLTQRPKPMRRAAPAGSVYLFQAPNNETIQKVVEKYHGQSLCQMPDDREGFGICLIAQPFNNQII